jgi:hypothetical protein
VTTDLPIFAVLHLLVFCVFCVFCVLCVLSVLCVLYLSSFSHTVSHFPVLEITDELSLARKS